MMVNRGGGGGRRPRGGGMGRGGMFVNRQRDEKRLYEKEYDFEQANTKFEELRVKLAETTIGGVPGTGGQITAVAPGAEDGE